VLFEDNGKSLVYTYLESKPTRPPSRASNPPIPPVRKPTIINTTPHATSFTRFEPKTATIPRIKLITPIPKYPASGTLMGKERGTCASAVKLRAIIVIPPNRERM